MAAPTGNQPSPPATSEYTIESESEKSDTEDEINQIESDTEVNRVESVMQEVSLEIRLRGRRRLRELLLVE